MSEPDGKDHAVRRHHGRANVPPMTLPSTAASRTCPLDDAPAVDPGSGGDVVMVESCSGTESGGMSLSADINGLCISERSSGCSVDHPRPIHVLTPCPTVGATAIF